MTDSHETMRDLIFVRALLAEAEAGRPFALASIHATRRSMPRHAGARMALLSNGTWLGTIGGGRVEQMAQERMSAVLGDGAPDSIEWLTHAKTGMGCGGDALVSVRRSSDTEADLLRALVDALEKSVPSVLSEVWADGSRPTVALTRVEDLPAGDPAATCDMPAWDEAAMRFTEPIGSDPVAYIFGGGHVGRALCPVLAGVGFRVVVFDDREGIVEGGGFPTAEKVILGDFTNIAEHVSLTRRDYVVVTTHGHTWDIDVLEQAYAARPAYVGCIGSRAKAALARRTLVERGVPQEWADAIHLPIGEDILAVTPPEIAISIAAEMIRCRAELRPERPHSHPAPAPVAE